MNTAHYQSPEHGHTMPPAVGSRLDVTTKAGWFIEAATRHIEEATPRGAETSAKHVALDQTVAYTPPAEVTAQPTDQTTMADDAREKLNALYS